MGAAIVLGSDVCVAFVPLGDGAGAWRRQPSEAISRGKRTRALAGRIVNCPSPQRGIVAPLSAEATVGGYAWPSNRQYVPCTAAILSCGRDGRMHGSQCARVHAQGGV